MLQDQLTFPNYKLHTAKRKLSWIEPWSILVSRGKGKKLKVNGHTEEIDKTNSSTKHQGMSVKWFTEIGEDED